MPFPSMSSSESRNAVHIVDMATHKIVRADLPGEAVGLAWEARPAYLRVLAVEASHDRVVLLELPVTPDGVVDEVCGKAAANLSQTEWDRYLKGIPFHRTCRSLPAPE
jgi:hypothetical protein